MTEPLQQVGVCKSDQGGGDSMCVSVLVLCQALTCCHDGSPCRKHTLDWLNAQNSTLSIDLHEHSPWHVCNGLHSLHNHTSDKKQSCMPGLYFCPKRQSCIRCMSFCWTAIRGQLQSSRLAQQCMQAGLHLCDRSQPLTRRIT